ncbi:MAG: hypothetical protein KAR21_25340 [Spirochaetales bacterium]|nr:hypothetical protein [Spirochaetales bacterium]
MNIKKVRDIFKRDREVSLHDLSLETGEVEDDLKYILEDWEGRERIKIVKELPFCTSGGCSGCSFVSSCSTALDKKYRWV